MNAPPDPYFPWTHLGLRANPFQSLNSDDWLAIAWLPEPIKTWLEDPTAVLQLTGEKGSGKTSTLLALRKELSQRLIHTTYDYLPEDTPQPILEMPREGTMLVDEAQRLDHQTLGRLVHAVSQRTHAGDPPPVLIYSSHEDLSSLAAEYMNDFASFEISGLSAVDLAGMLDLRVRHFALEEGTKVRFQPEAVDFLITAFSPDLRRMEAFLYAFFQAVPADPVIEADDLRPFNEP